MHILNIMYFTFSFPNVYNNNNNNNNSQEQEKEQYLIQGEGNDKPRLRECCLVHPQRITRSLTDYAMLLWRRYGRK